MLTREALKSFCPYATEGYLQALTDVDWCLDPMNRLGISHTRNRFVFCLANGLHETGALRVEAENMNYRTVDRLEAVWPTRFKWGHWKVLAKYGLWPYGPPGTKEQKLAVARIAADPVNQGVKNSHYRWCQGLLNNAHGLAYEVYNGRMGNRPGTSDGYVFRGHGLGQVTGRNDYLLYGKMIQVDFDAHPEYTEYMTVMTAMYFMEVYNAGLNDLADQGDFDGYCAKLNTGDARNVKGTVGLEDRRAWKQKLMTWIDQPQALVAFQQGYNPDGDTVPGQQEHWMAREEDESLSASAGA